MAPEVGSLGHCHPTNRRSRLSVREALSEILEETYDIVGAGDGPSALAALGVRLVDAVLLDLGLPGMNGFEVLARMRLIAPSVPVVIVTVKDRAADAVRAFKLGARDYVTKPFDEDLILTTLAQALTVSPPMSPQNDDRLKGSGETAR
jgi:DNA-binding response OmpR family regulator